MSANAVFERCQVVDADGVAFTVTERSEYRRPKANIVSSCLIAGVSRATIYRWLDQGLIEAVRTPTGHLRIYVDTLLRKPIER